MKVFKSIIVLLITILLGWYFYELWDDKNLLTPGKLRVFELDRGDHLTLKMSANGSTGYANCWINEDKCESIELYKTDYKPNLNSRLGYIGSGGWKYFEFKATEVGIDTILIHNCPIKDVMGEKPNGCEAFQNKIENSDYKIIVRIETKTQQ